MTPEQLAKSNTEHAHQRALFARVNAYKRQHAESHPVAAKLEWLHAIPNGGDRHKATASKVKAEGAKAGVWDLFLPVPMLHNPSGILHGSKWQHGLYIEMKEPGRRNHKDGGLTNEQIKFGEYARAAGYATEVCYTWEEAFAALMRYLGG